MKRHITRRKLGAFTIAAGAAAIGAAGTAQGALQVFDHRASSLFSVTDYWLWDQTMILMNVKTGDFQYVQEQGGNGGETDGVNDVIRYNQDGVVDTNLIPESDKTDETVWMSHRDMAVPGKTGGADGVTFETPTGGAGGLADVPSGGGGNVYVPGRADGTPPSTWTPHEWYWAHQNYDHDDDPGTPNAATNGVLWPADIVAGETPHPFAADGSFSYHDSSPTGYTGAVTHGFGGIGHGSGSWFWVEDPDGSRSFAIPFRLEEADGTHYGWVAMTHNTSRNRVWVSGWAYQTTPGAAAELRWDGDPVSTLDGDFDGDGDVDADDVDTLCANMGGDPGTYDMDGDGDVDEDDMTFHVENYLEYDSNGDSIPDGQGTFRGDFNTDGVVNGTDLSLMNGNFGGLTGFAGGNANCDSTVNGTDLSILAGVFGSVATSAVPEPMTITLLSLSGLAILRRRNR